MGRTRKRHFDKFPFNLTETLLVLQENQRYHITSSANSKHNGENQPKSIISESRK